MSINQYKPIEERATDAGVSRELAHLMYNVVRGADQHGWMSSLVEWVADEEAMISRALKNPEKMAEACELLFATDGLMYDEGQVDAGISDEKRREIEGWIFTGVLAQGMTKCKEIPAFGILEMMSAIGKLREAARHQTGAGSFCEQFLAACLGKVEIDLSEVSRLDLENSAAAMIVFSGLAYHCGETRNLIEGQDD